MNESQRLPYSSETSRIKTKHSYLYVGFKKDANEWEFPKHRLEDMRKTNVWVTREVEGETGLT